MSETDGQKRSAADKLIAYGFTESGGQYVYRTSLLGGQFDMTVTADADGILSSVVSDRETGEPYTLHLTDFATGAFVGKVRAEYERVLSEIEQACFKREVYAGETRLRVEEYVRTKYGGELEYLWHDDNAIWRRADNNKWYGVVLRVDGTKLGLSKGIKDIIDLRIEPGELEAALDGKTRFRGYHMNKKSWITLLMDGSVPVEEICAYIDRSYALAADKIKARSKKG